MATYVIRRLLWLPVVLVVISMVTFFLLRVAPGDPVQIMLGQRINPETVERLRAEYGLDRPIPEQYLIYMSRLVQGDFGESYRFRGTPVLDVLLSRMWVSAQLGTLALLVMAVGAIPLGIFAALKQGSWLDTVITSSALVIAAIPATIMAPVFILFFVRFPIQVLGQSQGWLPASGFNGIFDPRVIMPVLVLSLGGMGVLARLVRTSTLEVVGQDYIRTARSKGLRESRIIVRHMLKNSMLPIVTVLGLSLATVVEGAFIVELFFGIPGMGSLAIDSVLGRDYPVIMGLTLILAAIYVVVNLAVDIVYGYLDPRIRISQ